MFTKRFNHNAALGPLVLALAGRQRKHTVASHSTDDEGVTATLLDLTRDLALI